MGSVIIKETPREIDLLSRPVTAVLVGRNSIAGNQIHPLHPPNMMVVLYRDASLERLSLFVSFLGVLNAIDIGNMLKLFHEFS